MLGDLSLNSDQERLQERIRQLAAEKANLHLVLRLIERMNPLGAVEDLLKNLMESVLDTIGGTNIHVHYWDDGQCWHVDFLGHVARLEAIEDPLARQVAELRSFVELEVDGNPAAYREGANPASYHWGFPLLDQDVLVGVVTLEHLNITGRSMGKYLPIFFGHAALLLNHELNRRRRDAAEQALRLKTQELDAYFNTSLDLFVIANLEGFFLKVNPSWEKVLGYRAEDLNGVRFLDLVHPEDLAITLEAMERLAHQQPVFDFVNRYRHRDGSWRWIEWRTAPCGDIIHAAARDITARKQTEQALRIKDWIIESSIQGIATSDMNGRLDYVNPSFLRLWGYSEPSQVLGRQATEFWSPEAQAEAVREAVLTRGFWQGNMEAVRQDGTRFEVQVLTSMVLNDKGAPVCLQASFLDLTDLRRAEAERRDLQAQLQQAQKLESLGSLAGGVAHDMNNVLAAVLGLASAGLTTHAPGTPTHKSFQTILKACERGGKMVQGLLGFARRSPAEQRPLDLNVLLRESLGLLAHTTLSRVTLAEELAPDLRPISGDAGDLAHAVMNLCLNAVDAMPDGGTLTLRSQNLGPDQVVVEIEDTGCGMPAEVMEKALDPFFTTKPQGKGTGLGLSLVFGTVKAHGGRLELHSRPGQGTRIRMLLPAASPLEEPRPLPGAVAPETAPHRLRILLVDDDELIRASMAAMFDLMGHPLHTATRGEEALEMLEGGLVPDLVILDMNMPGLGGAGTLPRIRQHHPALPIFLATGRADQKALDLVHAHTGVRLLPKPFTFQELERALQGVEQPTRPGKCPSDPAE